MPHVPGDHTAHDHVLVAASATDELTDTEHATVTRLLAACADCRQLQADLRSLAAATVALPVAPRRRDYRLTGQDAARLRPAGLRAVLASLGSRRFSFAAPLGTAIATLGIVGLLVAAIPGPLAAGTALRLDSGQRAGGEIEAARGGDTQAAPSDATTAFPYSDPAPRQPAPEPGDGDAITLQAVAAELTQARGLDEVLVILGGTGLLVGLALLVLRWMGRQLA